MNMDKQINKALQQIRNNNRMMRIVHGKKPEDRSLVIDRLKKNMEYTKKLMGYHP
jgi:hypothetical protein